ncbi:MAG: class I SAM-dependent methyltransferase [Candidatus Odinarchaeota archaeon]
MSQQEHWNKIWSENESDNQPSSFCQKTLEELPLPVNSQILELACGQGYDTEFFLCKGYEVRAVDFASEALRSMQERLKIFIQSRKLQVHLLDLKKEFLAQTALFDLVYSHLGLHYFSLERTRELFKLIYDVLKPQGWIAIAVNSTNDVKHGHGDLLEPSMYIYKGHVRRFIDKNVLESIFLKQFRVLKMEEVKEHTKYGIRTRFHSFARKPE